MRIIEIGTAVSVLIILILVYRNLVTMLVPRPAIRRQWSLRRHVVRLAEFDLAVNMGDRLYSAVVIRAGTITPSFY